MERFGGISLDELDGKNVNRPENMLTLSIDPRRFFGRLKIWLEPEQVRPYTCGL